MKKNYMLMLLALLCVGNVFAANVKVAMNSTSKTMTLADKTTGEAVETGAPSGTTYEFETAPGTYVLTAYGTNGTTVNGTIEINVKDEEDQQLFTVLTCTAYATNTGWTEGNDYTLAVDVNSREGVKQVITIGNSTTTGRKTFLALNGNSYYASFIPSAAHQAEGYMTLYKTGTLTGGVTVSGAIPVGVDYSVTLPANAEFELAMKFSHFIDFTKIEPTSTNVSGSTKTINYRLANSQVYNYRTWREGGLTQGGYFTMNTDATKRPALSFTDADYAAFGAKTIKHDVQWNGGYETGDIFVNINERGHLKMNVGDTYNAHAMRTWELTDNSTTNYFIEPDFHYTVINPDGTPSTGVIEIDNANTTTSPWSKIKAVGNGTAIVLVTYDAIGLNTYASGKTDKTPYMGGEYWSAIWPENTAAYVVTVGDAENSIDPNMVINEDYNTGTLKNSGKYVDAEHDVFYYLDTEAGYTYTFTPTGVSDVQIAYPTIGSQMATYNGFASTGVTKNEDGSYSLLLKEGRQIVKLTDASGNSVYQVLTAKTCHREITNVKNPGSNIFQRGDQVKIQYSGLRHPANKLAGIYNMSGYVTYNGIPNGTSLILGSGQYTFGSAASAQAVSIDIPADLEGDQLVLDKGVIQVNGFGDPIGNHRVIDPIGGRSANFTAIAHKTYFGAIPDVVIPVSETRNIQATVNLNPEAAGMLLKDANGKVVVKKDGKYPVTLGVYSYEAKCSGYRVLRGSFVVPDDAEDEFIVDITLDEAPEGAWDGTTKTEPASVDGVYQIKTGAELAWFANNVNSTKNYTAKAVLCNDIDLAGHDWTAIGGTAASTAFKGTFDGQGNTVSGIYVNTTATYKGFFGYTSAATIKNLTVEGDVISAANYAAGVVAYANASTITNVINKVKVSGKQYVGGITSYASGATTIDRCGNEADIAGTSNYVAGITPYMAAATTVVSNCYNTGVISGGSYVATLVGNIVNKSGVVKNSLALGKVEGNASTGNVYANTQVDREGITNNYVIKNYTCGADYETVVTSAQLASGEVAYLLGEAWGQDLGVDAVPVLGGKKVYKSINGYTNDSEVDASYKLAILTFEDEDFKGSSADQCTGVADWSSLIDNPQYGGPLLYGESGYGLDENYYWCDTDNTFLAHEMPYNWGSYCYWGGGHAISNYGSNDIKSNGGYETQLTVYNKNANGNVTSGSGHNGSNNFCVQYGYRDNSGYSAENLPYFYFSDGVARVIDHMYVNNTTYALNCYVSGNDLTAAIGKDDWVKIVAIGDNDNTSEFYLCNGPDNIVTDWTKWDLSSLGEVTMVEFNIEGSSDNGYGFSQPAYFAYDDVAVRVPNEMTLEDKTAYDSEVTTTVPSLTYKRNFNNTDWQALYVPFAMDADNWAGMVDVAEFVDYGNGNLKVRVIESGNTEPNKPYLIRAKEAGQVEIEMTDATLVPSENNGLTIGDATITGVYQPLTGIKSMGAYAMASGALHPASSDSVVLSPMRWYLTTASGNANAISISIEGGETGVIEKVSVNDKDNNLYDITGRKIQSMKKPGLYISGGKVIKID